MSEEKKIKERAHKLRLKGKIKDALPLFQQLVFENEELDDMVGLLYCLRRLNKFDEALPLADRLKETYLGFDWANSEIACTYLHGRLKKFKYDEPFNNVTNLAKEIISISNKEHILFPSILCVLRHAEHGLNWNEMSLWCDKVDPLSLSTSQMKTKGWEGWSYQAMWYNYKILSLIELSETEQASKLIEEALAKFPKQKVFFEELKEKV